MNSPRTVCEALLASCQDFPLGAIDAGALADGCTQWERRLVLSLRSARITAHAHAAAFAAKARELQDRMWPGWKLRGPTTALECAVSYMLDIAMERAPPHAVGEGPAPATLALAALTVAAVGLSTKAGPPQG
eukprot:13977967-Alexandrium_andersonii.AAC.1